MRKEGFSNFSDFAPAKKPGETTFARLFYVSAKMTTGFIPSSNFLPG